MTNSAWVQAQEPRSRQRVTQCATKHRYALAGCLAVVAVYLLWMATTSLSGKRGEPGWVHRRERGSGSIGTFKLRHVPATFLAFVTHLRTSQNTQGLLLHTICLTAGMKISKAAHRL